MLKANTLRLRNGAEFVGRSILDFSIRQKSIDILHVHSGYAIMGTVPGFLKIYKHTPMVFTLYSPLAKNSVETHDKFYRYLSTGTFATYCFRRLDKIIAVSENVKNSLIDVGIDEKKLSVIPPSVDTSRFNSNVQGYSKEQFGIANSSPMILYCGNWSKWKGVRFLIQAMPDILKSFPDAKLVLAWGEPHNWYDDRKLAINHLIHNLKLQSSVIELGIVENIERLMATCDVYATPFISTAGVADLPLVILEAMACGKPIVATDVGGVREIVRNKQTGYLVEPGDCKKLAQAINNVLSDRNNATNMGRLASEYVIKNHNIEITTSKTQLIYEQQLLKR